MVFGELPRLAVSSPVAAGTGEAGAEGAEEALFDAFPFPDPPFPAGLRSISSSTSDSSVGSGPSSWPDLNR